MELKYWHCPKCGHTYRSHIDDDLSERRSCSFCSGQPIVLTYAAVEIVNQEAEDAAAFRGWFRDVGINVQSATPRDITFSKEEALKILSVLEEYRASRNLI
jgi:hypothetical protein